MSGARIHLGDGAYVSHDGWQFDLSAERPGGTHHVYLEPGALVALVAYAVAQAPGLADELVRAAGGAL